MLLNVALPVFTELCLVIYNEVIQWRVFYCDNNRRL